jgi:tetratricopeptide (TPR) repeat protein
MTRRLTRARGAALLATLAGLLVLGGCAARTAAPPPVVTPKFPQFVFPALEPGEEPALVARHQNAWQWLQAGQLGEAEREFGAVLRRRPQLAPAESGLGYVALARRDPDDALARFDAALQGAPGYAPALAGRGQALLALGRDAEALESFEAALAADPSLELGSTIEVLRFRTAQDFVTTARKAAADGRLDEARAAYEQAIAGSPESAFLYRELGVVEQRAGRLESSLQYLNKAAELDPADARVHVHIGDVLFAAGRHEEALRAYESANNLETTPELTEKIDAARERVEMARLPAEFHAIRSAPAVSRADVAAMLGLRMRAWFATIPPRQGVLLTDIRGHWAAPSILTVVRTGIMEPLPNHTFQPGQRVRRAEFAHIVSRVLDAIREQRPGAARDWQSASLAITDVPSSHPSHAAVSRAVAAGVLSLDGTEFHPARPLTGAELDAAVTRLDALAGSPPRRR